VLTLEIPGSSDAIASFVLGASHSHHSNNHNDNFISIPTSKKGSSQSKIDPSMTRNIRNSHNLTSKTNAADDTSNNGANSGKNNNKFVILTFGDVHKTQFTSAKPILDRYGFKGSFFVTCGYVDKNNAIVSDNNVQLSRMSWNDILALQQDGQDIESKGMTHRDLNQLPLKDLEFEIGGSKQCLENHGINPTIFAVVHGDGWNNTTIINMIGKYYGFADNGFADLIFLHCDGYIAHKQIDCKTYDEGGKLTYANRYSIREESHNSWDVDYLHNDQIIIQKFINQVNSQVAYNNKKGFIDAIPIVAYHSIDNSKGPSSTDVGLFALEMKYLHDNGFKIIPMADLGYDENTNFMYIKQ
jgi:peptidoglycan/xylan/chitin deacetylase (PgdA/CDA1 family)